MRHLIVTFGIAAVLILTGLLLVNAQPVAQVATETPAQINLEPPASGSSGDTVEQAQATLTWTPTPPGVALLEAKEFANVRAEPSTEASQLGTIRVGETYNVIGRYISWIQFQYPSSPTGRGWVYGELVNLTGNVDNIPEIDPFSQPQLDSASINATATVNQITQTPGGILTATAQARQVALPGAETATPEGTRAILPTFTYPPGMVALAPTLAANVSPESTDAVGSTAPVTRSSEGVPPIVPILVLGGVGLIGLILSSLRRG